ncbi:hypothetical protein Q0812_03175 [Brevundimonas sp. 2R-24]|uniref:Uncharacterized protein n=1 Tax=Peiella sedimenti TaxID=3061083 RepID=A0ABT8SMC9_9CAUL|nr:hypothetical protein [Caulobacteraceae bacterium XZ-24]
MDRRTLILAAMFGAALPAQAQSTHDGWTRRMEDGLLVSTKPDLTLRIDPAFQPLPPLSFPILDLTDAERRVFVDAGTDRRIRRMIVIQYEHAQAGSPFRFLFPSHPPRTFGEQTYRTGAFAYDDEAAARTNPDREAGRTRAFLIDAGYQPPLGWDVARLARVSDEQGLTEVIIFYMEARASMDGAPVDEDGDVILPPKRGEALHQGLRTTVIPVRG